MRKFKEGDKAIVLKNTSGHRFSIGAEVEVVGESGIHNGETEYECKTISEYWFLTTSELKKKENLEYKTSNRYKLQQAIKATGYSSRRLSDIAVGNESYFYNYTGKARFDKKGDITEERLNSLLTTLAFAERELLGVGAKTVDDNELSFEDYPLYDSKVDYPADAKVNHNGEIKFAADIKAGCGNSENEDYHSYVDQLQSQAIEKKYFRLRNFMIVFLIIDIILSIYFFTR